MAKKIFVIGNGPSLNKVDVTALKDQETISFNRAYIAYDDWGFYPTHYMVCDPIVLENIKEDIKKMIQVGHISNFILPASSALYFGKSPRITYVHYQKIPLIRRFWAPSFNLATIISNVGATSIPLLRLLGYRQVVILGTDCNYVEQDIKGVEIEKNEDSKDRKIVYKSSTDDDLNHFRPDYFGKGTEYSKPQTGNHFRGWQFIGGSYEKAGMDVRLCSPGSRLAGLFPEIDFKDALSSK